MIRALVAVGVLVWAAVGIAASVALARTIRLVQDEDGVPIDSREWLFVDDILNAAEVAE